MNRTYTANSSVDVALGCVYLVLSTFGVCLNLMSFYIFIKLSKKSSRLYVVISLVDFFISLLGLVWVPVLFNGRSPSLFRIDMVCAMWRGLFKTLQKYSITLVWLLSTVRMLALLRPFQYIPPCLPVLVFLVYAVLEICEVASLATMTKYVFVNLALGCYEVMRNRKWAEIALLLHYFSLAIPMVLIVANFVITIIRLYRVRVPVSGVLRARSDTHRKATITVCVVTVLYIICNIPVVVIYSLYMSTVRGLGSSPYPQTYFSSQFMRLYVWNITDVLSVVVNSALNPVVYLCRVGCFRRKLFEIYHDVIRSVNMFKSSVEGTNRSSVECTNRSFVFANNHSASKVSRV